MKILIIPSWYPRESNKISGIFFKEQAEQLAESGNEVSVFFPEQYSIKKPSNLLKLDQNIGEYTENSVNLFKTSNINWFSRIPKMKKKSIERQIDRIFLKFIKGNSLPDIIHAHSALYGGTAAVYLGKKYGIPVVITEHSSKVLKQKLNKSEEKIFLNTMEKANKIICVSENLKRILNTNYNITDINVIPNSIDFNRFKESNVVKGDDVVKFGCLCFLNRNKNVTLLIKAFHKYFKNKNAILIIGGDGEERPYLESLSKELSINNQVFFQGKIERENVPSFMSQIDIFVSTSNFETFGVVLIEALACGIPIISTLSGGPNDIVNKKNGFLIEVNNLVELGEKMIYLHENLGKYNPNIIKEDAQERFSNKVVIQKIIDTYREII